MRKDQAEAEARRGRLKAIACAMVGAPLMVGALWWATVDANRVRPSDSIVSYVDAREMVGSFSQSVGGAPLVLARTGEWPSRKYPGLDMAVERRTGGPGRLSYDVVVTAGNERVCEGAIAGGRVDATIVRIGDVILPPPAVQPYRNGKATVDPSRYLCDGRAYPVVLRFSHEIAVPQTVSAGAR